MMVDGDAPRAAAPRPFGPKPHDHPTVGRLCPGCYRVFVAGDFSTLLPIGPGDNSEEQDKARARCFYRAVAIEVHWACATGSSKP